MKEGKFKMMQVLNKKHKLIGNKGFSLIELIIVIAIMAVLMAILAPQLLKYVEKSRVQADNTAASEIVSAVRVALTDEDTVEALSATQTVIWSGPNHNITVSGGATALISDQLTATLGDITDFHVKSKAHLTQSYTITINVVAGVASVILPADWA